MGGSSSRNTGSSLEASVTSPHRKQLEEIYEELCHNGSLHKGTFMEHFTGPSEFIAELLFREMTGSLVCEPHKEGQEYEEHHHREHLMNKDLFISRALKVIEKAYKSKRIQLAYYYNLVAANKQDLTQNDITQILAFCCVFGFLVGNYDTKFMDKLEEDKFLVAHAKSCIGSSSTRSKQEFLEWVEELNPNLFAAFQSWIHRKLTSVIPGSHFQMLPLPNGFDSVADDGILTPSLLWYLCCILPSCYTQPDKRLQGSLEEEEEEGQNQEEYRWSLLYNGNQHGLSMNRFKHKCMDYKSPTVALFQFRSGMTLALTLDTAWQDSSSKFGGPYSSLLEITPTPAMVLGMPNIVYLRSTGRNVHTGLLVGDGEPAKIKLDSDFCNAEILYKGSVPDEVTQIEVWGCGGAKAMTSQRKQKAWDKKEVEKRGKVKLPGRWEDNPDRSILEMGGVQVSHNERQDI